MALSFAKEVCFFSVLSFFLFLPIFFFLLSFNLFFSLSFFLYFCFFESLSSLVRLLDIFSICVFEYDSFLLELLLFSELK